MNAWPKIFFTLMDKFLHYRENSKYIYISPD